MNRFRGQHPTSRPGFTEKPKLISLDGRRRRATKPPADPGKPEYPSWLLVERYLEVRAKRGQMERDIVLLREAEERTLREYHSLLIKNVADGLPGKLDRYLQTRAVRCQKEHDLPILRKTEERTVHEHHLLFLTNSALENTYGPLQ